MIPSGLIVGFNSSNSGDLLPAEVFSGMRKFLLDQEFLIQDSQIHPLE